MPLRDVSDQVLTWTRADFLALRYELRCDSGVAAQVSVTGTGESKHALGETNDGGWRFEIFPFASGQVQITRAGDSAEVGHYNRESPHRIRLADQAYSFEPAADTESVETLTDESGRALFTFEQTEIFPHWQAAIKLHAGAIKLPDLPVLLLSSCCLRVFR